MKTHIWNPWHGCFKYSEGCDNCYVYRRDRKIGKDAGNITKNACFSLPLEKDRNRNFKIKSGDTVWCCMTSDFFLAEADKWRNDIWDIIRLRNDVNFNIITKRITRFYECIPEDWGMGWDNVSVFCTCENRKRAIERLPFFAQAPIKHKHIVCEPLLEQLNLLPYLADIKSVTVGGESGNEARECDFDWVLDIREQCIEAEVEFWFKQTGAKFRKNGKLFRIHRKFQHSQAHNANINYSPKDNKL